MLHQAGRGGQGIVGRLRAKQQKIDRRAVDVELGEQLFGRRHAQVRGTLVGGRDVPGANARLGVDQIEVPVGKLGLQIVVGFHLVGQMNRDRTDCCVLHRPRASARNGFVRGRSGPSRLAARRARARCCQTARKTATFRLLNGGTLGYHTPAAKVNRTGRAGGWASVSRKSADALRNGRRGRHASRGHARGVPSSPACLDTIGPKSLALAPASNRQRNAWAGHAFESRLRAAGFPTTKRMGNQGYEVPCLLDRQGLYSGRQRLAGSPA